MFQRLRKRLFPKGLLTKHSAGICRRARERLKSFKELESVSSDAKQQVLPQVRHYEIRLAAMEYKEFRVKGPVVFAILIPGAFNFFLAPVLVADWLGFNFTAISQDRSLVTSIFIIYLVAIFISYGFLLLLALPKLSLGAQYLWVATVLVAFSLVIYCVVSVAAAISISIVIGVVAAMFWYIVAILSAVILVIVFSLISWTFEKRANSRYPDAVLTHSLLEILSMVESKPRQWTNLEFKRRIMYQLELAASCVEHSLLRRLRSGDVETDAWLEETLSEIATAFRANKKWILTPKPDTRTQFLGHIADSFVCAAGGNWDGLKRVKREEFPRPRIWLTRAKEALGAIVIGGLPLLALWLIQLTPLAIDKPAIDYLAIGALIWASLTLLAVFDPLYRAKLEALKDVTQLLPFGGKGKK